MIIWFGVVSVVIVYNFDNVFLSHKYNIIRYNSGFYDFLFLVSCVSINFILLLKHPTLVVENLLKLAFSLFEKTAFFFFRVPEKVKKVHTIDREV